MKRNNWFTVATLLAIAGILTYYTMPPQVDTLDQQAEKLAQSLNVLSGEIRDLRKAANTKEEKYNSVLSGLVQPVEETEKEQPTAMFGCLNEEGIIDKQLEDKIENYDFVADANVFEDISGAWIRKSDGAECYRSEIVVK